MTEDPGVDIGRHQSGLVRVQTPHLAGDHLDFPVSERDSITYKSPLKCLLPLESRSLAVRSESLSHQQPMTSPSPIPPPTLNGIHLETTGNLLAEKKTILSFLLCLFFF